MNYVVLDVAIGMSFVYLLLSLIASVVQETLSTFMQLRAANLEKGLRSLFSGDKIGSELDLVESIYNHGLVRGLYQNPAMDLKTPEHKDAVQAAQALDTARAVVASTEQAYNVAVTENHPDMTGIVADHEAAKTALEAACKRAGDAVVAVENLSKRLLDPVRNLLRRIIGASPAKEMNVMVVPNPMLLPAYIPSATFAQALIDTLNTNKLSGDAAMTYITQMLRDHAWQFRDNMATEALLALALKSEGKLPAFQSEVEDWYNAGMDRASGWYKRKTQNMLLAVGLLLAISFNVDSIKVARTLWTDRDVRQGILTVASDYSRNHPQVASAPSTTNFDANALQKQMDDTVDKFSQVADKNLLPLGWQHSPWKTFVALGWSAKASYLWARLTSGNTWALLLGWCLTAAAISLGAPFWFDTLNKFMVVRGTVKPAEKSKAEVSKS